MTAVALHYAGFAVPAPPPSQGATTKLAPLRLAFGASQTPQPKDTFSAPSNTIDYPPQSPLASLCLFLIEGVYQGLTGNPDQRKHGALYCQFKEKRPGHERAISDYSCSQYCAEAIRRHGAIKGCFRFFFCRNLLCQGLGPRLMQLFPQWKQAALTP
jgi:hypothetical protein